MFFKAGKGSLQTVFGSDRRYWSQKMKSALGLASTAGFPYQWSPMNTTLNKSNNHYDVVS